MQVNSFDQAIDVTMNKYNYNEEQKIRIYEELEKGNYNVITSDFGARKFIKQYYENLKNRQILPFENFTTLNNYFDKILSIHQVTKENEDAMKILYMELLNNKDKFNLENLLIQAAKEYSIKTQNNSQISRNFDFSTPDLTRKEAADLTRIFSEMEHQKYQIIEALNKYPNYQKALFINLINYVYYENDFSQSLEDKINQVKSSKI